MDSSLEFDEINNANTIDELKAMKVFLFKENLRLAQEKRGIEEERIRLQTLQDDFIKDRVKLKEELEELNRKTLAERKRLKEENLFFEKKMAILKDGFRSLEADRREIDLLKRQLQTQLQNSNLSNDSSSLGPGGYDSFAEIMFRGVNSAPALRKRYRDLLKIFHPDNNQGDVELAQALNRVYQRRKEEY